MSAGGGYSTVGDLARFAHALTSHTLLGPRYTQMLITRKVSSGYAYGFDDAPRLTRERLEGTGARTGHERRPADLSEVRLRRRGARERRPARRTARLGVSGRPAAPLEPGLHEHERRQLERRLDLDLGPFGSFRCATPISFAWSSVSAPDRDVAPPPLHMKAFLPQAPLERFRGRAVVRAS